jgi:branched-chain amino acid transport system substrate-binding protein
MMKKFSNAGEEFWGTRKFCAAPLKDLCRIRRMRDRIGKVVSILCLSLAILGPVPAVSTDDAPNSNEEKEIFQSAKQSYDQGDYILAETAVQDLLQEFPDSRLIPEAYFLLGQTYIQLQRYKEAIAPLKAAIQGNPEAPFAGEARLQLGRVFLQLGMLEEAIPILEREAVLSADPVTKRNLYAQIADLYLSSGDGVSAITALVKQYPLSLDEAEKIGIREKIGQVVEQHLNDEELRILSESYPQTFPGDVALLRLGEAAYTEGDLFRAEQYLNQFLVQFRNHSTVPRAKEILVEVRDRIMEHQYRIGVLLPLSGPQAPYADSVLKGMQLAMDVFKESLPDQFAELVIRDYKGQRNLLRKSLQQLINEYDSTVLVGPLLSKDVEMLSPVVEEYKIPLMTPTATANGISHHNPYIFRNTVTHEGIGRALAEYSILKAGLTRFVILYPNDSYGLELMRIFSEEVNRLGGEIIVAEAYAPDANDFGPEIRRVIELDLARYGAVSPPEKPEPGQKLQYIPGFDAVFLPGDPLTTGMLAAQLAFHDIKDRVLLIAHGANSPEFLSAGNRFVEGAILVDGFFEGSADPVVRDFVARYYAKFAEPPNLFAAQAYDGLQMILLALKNGASNRDEIRDYLAQIRGFHGASGMTTFHPTGQAEKSLFIIQVQNGQLVQVN